MQLALNARPLIEVRVEEAIRRLRAYEVDAGILYEWDRFKAREGAHWVI